MILLLGDIHGDWTILQDAIQKAEEVSATALIQVGDFCMFRGGQTAYNAQCANNQKDFHKIMQKSKVPVYFIDGNHDDCDRWVEYTEVTQVFDDAPFYYIPRGTVMELDGRTIAFMGGASSINKKWSIRDGNHWTPMEDIRQIDIDNLIKNAEGKKIDMFITHIPPHSVVQEHFDDSAKIMFEVGLDWHDQNQTIVEELWYKLGTPHIFSGHMHKRVVGMTYRILDINELLAV
jgi:Icc-related predicted phosphoesterase